MNRTVLLSNIERLIEARNLDRARVNEWVRENFGVNDYKRLPEAEMQLIFNSLLEFARRTTRVRSVARNNNSLP